MQEPLLALELSSEVSSLAVSVPAGFRERTFEGARGRVLLSEIDALLLDADLDKADLRGIVVGTGPGSYTGLRIACAAARTLSFALGVPAAGCCSFAAAAMEAPVGSRVHVLLDAYRGEVYHAVYERRENGVAECTAPRVLDQEDARQIVPEGSLLLGDASLCATSVQVLSPALRPRAMQLLELARAAGAAHALSEPRPLYLRAAAIRRR